ncbi:MAG: M24 family metallopeptidase [bacterium]|nr:M24 family metallopeptidase [bacterium]
MTKDIPLRKKTVDQIAAMREVQRATEAAMGAVISYLQSTQSPTSERAHKIIDDVLEIHNCESPEGHIVAGGKQGAEPHEMGHGLLQRGVPIVIDIYPRSKATLHFADMSRTVCIGSASNELRKMYDAVCAAQKLAMSMIKPKVECLKIQESVDKLFVRVGYSTSGAGKEFAFAEGFVHGVGHGVGIHVHEAPRIGRGSTDVLEEGDVVTVEPGLYYKHVGGIRLEDMILVTAGGAENLTNFPRHFEI